MRNLYSYLDEHFVLSPLEYPTFEFYIIQLTIANEGIELAMAEEIKGTTGASLADRLTTPDGSKFESPKADSNTNTAEDTPAKPSVGSSSWADEVETPVKADPEPATGSVAQPKETEPKDSDLAQAQLDGATETQGGTPMIEEPGYEVNVKLSDVQDDPNNPLYSIKRFEDLGL